jgi:aminoglycoside phosphotransferase (APT) family kinase protein
MAVQERAIANITTSWSPADPSAWPTERIEPTDVNDPLELDLPAVERWLQSCGTPVAGSLTATRISGGHSNITYRIVDAAGRAYVLRRPPAGQLPPGAHDVAREALLMTGLADSAVPVPRIVGTCTDPAVLGVPFYVMDWVDGEVVATPADARRVLQTDALRQAAADSLVDVLARLHGVDVISAGLGELVRPGNYVERQLGRMWHVWERTCTRDLPEMADLHDRLQQHRPPQRYTGLVHGDYRLGNVMVDPSGQLVAVLDWELATVGDVLCDLAFVVNNWESPGESADNAWMQEPPTRAGGFPERPALIERYAVRTGFDISDLDYYRAFSHWRMAVIAEGIKRRYESKSMASVDVDFDHLERRVRLLAALADRHLRAAGA